MASHIAQDVLAGTAPNTPRANDGGSFQPSKASRVELAHEYTRALLPAVRSRLILRPSDKRGAGL